MPSDNREQRTGHGGDGFLIAIDGPSGAGKTTVTSLLRRELDSRGVPALATRQPSDSAIGRLARTGTHELHGLILTFLMAADRHHHQDHVITPALAEGRVVICDRYLPSALVLDTLDGADPEFVSTIYRHLRRPGLTVLLTGDPARLRARAAARGLYSRFHHGGAAAGRREIALYEQAAQMLAERGFNVKVIDTSARTAQQVTEIVWTCLHNCLQGDGSTCHPTTDQPGKRTSR